MLSRLIQELEEHGKKFPEEKIYADQTLEWIGAHDNFAFHKQNLPGHVTASMIITNPERTKLLLMYHKKLELWTQFGGHADGEVDTLGVALREFHEESGIRVEPHVYPGIFSVYIFEFPEKNNVPVHLHYDIFYLGSVPENTSHQLQEKEVGELRWVPIEEIAKYNPQEIMLKLVKKIQSLYLSK